MRVQRAVGDGFALAHALAVLDLQADGIRHLILLDLAVVSGDGDVAQRRAVRIVDVDDAVDLGDLRHLLRLSGLEQFLNTGKTLRDIVARDTAGVEGTHGQLRARFADGLRGDDADGLAQIDKLARGKVHAVAACAHAGTGLAAEDGADVHAVDAVGRKLGGVLLAEHDVLGVQQLARLRVGDIVDRVTAADTVAEGVDELALLIIVALPAAVDGAAVVLADDDVLADVDHAAGQIAGVSGTERRSCPFERLGRR